MIEYFVVFGILLLLVALEDIQDNLAHHFGNSIFKNWWYAQNRWRAKYKNPEGPFGWADYKWWAKIGGTAFIDLWHCAKTLRIMIICGMLAYIVGWWAWTVVPMWVFYGAVHDHFLYGHLYRTNR